MLLPHIDHEQTQGQSATSATGWFLQARINQSKTTTRLFGSALNESGVQDVAESLNISNISDQVASMLASDVEYRIHQVVEVCLKEK
jgi:hypothetical protein